MADEVAAAAARLEVSIWAADMSVPQPNDRRTCATNYDVATRE
jgi:hypothetical protein